ncbi:MAG: hypothetical protein MI756_18710 [Chromatiales bacterium]|nr:hypothetical protein [Chromatiales bacterium]
MSQYIDILRQDHFFHPSQMGMFNPGFLFIEERGKTDLQKSLIGMHEFRHAKLSNSILGRNIIFLQFISSELHLYSLKMGTNKNAYLNYKKKIDRRIKRALSQWESIQEGTATFGDYLKLNQNQNQNNESKILLKYLINFLKKDSIYKHGFSLAQELSKKFNSDPHLLFHIFGNGQAHLDKDLNIKINNCNISDWEKKYFTKILNSNSKNLKDSIKSKNWTQTISQLIKFGFYITETPVLTNVLYECIHVVLSDPSCPKKYKQRLEELKEAHQKHVPIRKKSYLYANRVAYHTNRDNLGRLRIATDSEIKNKELDKKIFELNILSNLSSQTPYTRNAIDSYFSNAIPSFLENYFPREIEY